MKKYNFIFLTAVLGMTLAIHGCDSFLDAEPQQSITEELAVSTPQNVRNTLVGAYGLMAGGTQFGGQWFYLPELLASDGELTWSGTFFPQRDIWLKQQLANNAVVTNTWNNAYNTINTVNNVLASMDVFDEVADANIIPLVEGEAKFIRGTVYFYLVNMYGKTWGDGDNSANLAVPLVTTPTQGGIGEEANVSRATVQQIYNQLIQDLTDAKNLLPATNGVFANTYAASAILSRVHLMRQEYAQARDEAHRVIDSGRYSMTPTYAGAFNNDSNSSEDVFAIQITSQDGANNMNLFYASTAFGGRGDIDIEDQHVDLYEDGDARLNQFYIDATDARRTDKFNERTANVPFVRLAEMHLTRAEGNFREGTNVGMAPEAELNAVRDRVGLTAVTLTSVDQILAERRVELAFEGGRLFDIKRTRGSVGSNPWNANILVFPIPEREMDANPGLAGQQNPGY